MPQRRQIISSSGSSPITVNPTVTYTLTPPAMRENLINGGSGTALPATEGASQTSYTLASTDFWTIAPSLTFVNCGMILAVVHNPTGGSISASYRFLKNGTSINTASVSVNAGQYVTIHFRNMVGAVAGDIFETRLWGSTSLLHMYTGLAMYPTQPVLPQQANLVDYVMASHPTPVVGLTPTQQSTNPGVMNFRGFNWDTVANLLSTRDATKLVHVTTGDIWRPDEGDAQVSVQTHSATVYPFYRRNLVPTSMVVKPLVGLEAL